MNIAASNAQSNAAPSRMDAATTTDLPADGDAAAGEAVQDFGQILSATVSRGTLPSADLKDGRLLAALPSDARGILSSNDDASVAAATADQPALLDLNAILGGRIDARKGAETDAPSRAKPTDEADDTANDKAFAQIALLTQALWHAVPVQAPATGGDDGSASARRGPASTTPGRPVTGAAAADIAKSVATDTSATPAVVDPADIAPLAALATARVGPSINSTSALTRNETARAATSVGASGIEAVTTNTDPAKPGEPPRLDISTDASGIDLASAKQDPVKPDDTTRVASPESATAAIEKVLGLAAAGTTPVVSDPGSLASQFVTQVAAQVSSLQGSLANMATTSTAALREPVATPAWSHELGQAAIRMATDDLQHASLRLNPEHLGPLDVQMRIDNGVAHMQFAAAHAETRAALEGSRATLDQMFGDQGIKLGDWSVGNSSSNASFARQFGSASTQGDGQTSSTGDGDAPEVGATVTMRATRQVGLVDTFA